MCAATADRISLKCEENSSFCLVRYQKIRTYLCDLTQINSRKDYILSTSTKRALQRPERARQLGYLFSP